MRKNENVRLTVRVTIAIIGFIILLAIGVVLLTMGVNEYGLISLLDKNLLFHIAKVRPRATGILVALAIVDTIVTTIVVPKKTLMKDTTSCDCGRFVFFK